MKIGPLRRVLVVTDMGDAEPSGLLRALIYRELFSKHGVEAHYVVRRSPAINKFLQRAGPVQSRLLAVGPGRGLTGLDRLLGRLNDARVLARANGYDAIYLQKVSSPSFVSALRRRTKARLIYDFGDAVWLNWRSGYAGAKIVSNLQLVDAVTTDNLHTMRFAERYNPNAFVVPVPPQLEEFDKLRAGVRREGEPVVIGWVGTPGTAFNLYHIWEPLERLFATHQDITLRLVGVGRDPKLLPRFERVRYSTVPFYDQATMLGEVLKMHIGIFPMFDIEDSHARGFMKATLYMAGGVSVVASPRGQVVDLIQHGVNGLLADSPREWMAALEGLISDAAARGRVADEGLRTVRSHLTLEHCFQNLVAALVGDRSLSVDVPGIPVTR